MLEQNFGYATLPDNIQRSTFKKNYRYKGTFDADELIPFFRQDYYPGDEYSVKSTIYARLATPMFPIMDDIMLETFYFEVPYRLIWNNWKQFFGEVVDPVSNPTTPADFTFPCIDTDGINFTQGSFHDHLGLPIGVTDLFVNATWSRAYNFIINEWFRDQNLQDSLHVDTGDGPDMITNYPIFKVNKHHDYFTSCLPWPQKFDEVTVPLGTTAPVIGTGMTLGLEGSEEFNTGLVAFQDASGYMDFGGSAAAYGSTRGDSHTVSSVGTQYNRAQGVTSDPTKSGLMADLTEATAATINDLREAFALQRMQELMARTGSRYTEQVFALFRVKSPDARQQRPVYLGGGKQYINVSENRVNTSTNTDASGNVDTMNISAYLDVFSQDGFRAAFTEHGVILGLCCVRSAQTYQQGVPRWMRYRTRDDFYAPPLAHLGEQPVYNAEIFAQGTSADEDVFGYQERWSERRTNTSVTAGQFKSDSVQSLDAWHLAQDFATLPTLNTDFIESNTSELLDRCVALTDYPDILMDAYHEITYTTQMPVASVPGLIDHF
jgi:hypothetical protein